MPSNTNAYGREAEIPNDNSLPILGNILANLFGLAERLYLSHNLAFRILSRPPVVPNSQCIVLSSILKHSSLH